MCRNANVSRLVTSSRHGKEKTDGKDTGRARQDEFLNIHDNPRARDNSNVCAAAGFLPFARHGATTTSFFFSIVTHIRNETGGTRPPPGENSSARQKRLVLT